MSVRILKPGLQTTIQSCPRIGLRHLGVPASGAADPLSMALANRLVGNAWDEPALEATLLGPVIEFDAPCAFALTGGRASATLNGEVLVFHETHFASRGDVLDIGALTVGARVYFAVAGGLGADEMLGSTSTYSLAGFGGFQGRALEAGDALTVVPALRVRAKSTPAAFRPPMTHSWALRATAAPETGKLSAHGRGLLFDTNWTVDRRADRMGIRLDGPRLEVGSDGRMASAAVFPGTVQCPEDGAPFVLGVDAGTVGGYPRVAHVASVDRHLLGQLRPGDHLRLLERSPDEAVEALRAMLDYWREWLPDIAEILL